MRIFPFEVWNNEKQRHDFCFDKFEEYELELFDQYPNLMNHQRIECDLMGPYDNLHDVEVHDWNPHHAIGNHHLSNYDCFYDSDDWSIIFEPYPCQRGSGDSVEQYKLFLEKGHQNPLGDRVRILSTASKLEDQASHRYAYVWGKWWKLTSCLFFKGHPLYCLNEKVTKDIQGLEYLKYENGRAVEYEEFSDDIHRLGGGTPATTDVLLICATDIGKQYFKAGLPVPQFYLNDRRLRRIPYRSELCSCLRVRKTFSDCGCKSSSIVRFMDDLQHMMKTYAKKPSVTFTIDSN